jgi:dihydrofolate reductase
MLISLIAALDRNGVIGAGGDIPWRLPADMRHFKALTLGKPVIMGRRTYESIGRPLVDRHNIVVTRNRTYRAPGCTIVHSIAEALEVAALEVAALEAAGDEAEVMVIGGAHLYRQLLPQVDRLYLTYLDASFAGDTTFPPFDADEWQVVSEEAHAPDKRNPYPYRFVVLARRE